MKRSMSVRPSVCLFRRATGLLLSAVRAEDIDRQRRPYGAGRGRRRAPVQQRRRSTGRSTALSSK